MPRPKTEKKYSCGKPAKHVQKCWWKNPSTEYYCCRCWVEMGAPASDWHEECMQVERELENAKTEDQEVQ